jgi:XapX domain-containing protein
MLMKIYLFSLGAGLLVGVIYSLLNVRSPAPPVVALIGLLGILVGEQIVPLAKTLWNREPAATAWLNHIEPHIFGHLPGSKHDRLAALKPDDVTVPHAPDTNAR